MVNLTYLEKIRLATGKLSFLQVVEVFNLRKLRAASGNLSILVEVSESLNQPQPQPKDCWSDPKELKSKAITFKK
jgi:hypothetical protein